MTLIKLKPTLKFTVFDILTLKEAAVNVLSTEDVLTQAALTFYFVDAWKQKQISVVSDNYVDKTIKTPDQPGRVLPQSGSLPKLARAQAVTAIHGIAHAESYAMELFWDCVARYTSSDLPLEFYDDMVNIAGQEAKHFLDWYNRLVDLGCPYGSLWTHDGLWRAAEQTFHWYDFSINIYCMILLQRTL
jgi:uncharacterized ferritin-like protein (DUF455 family)